MAGVIADAELLLDQVGYPFAGPQRRLIAKFLRPFQQPGHQSLASLLIQQGLSSRPARRPERFFTALRDCVGPPAYGLAAYLHAARHFALVEALSQQIQCLKTSLLQLDEIPLHSSWITHAEKTQRKACGLRYIMRDSVGPLNRLIEDNRPELRGS